MSDAAQPSTSVVGAAPDEDGHCLRCGTEWTEDELSGHVTHGCPPGFIPRVERILWNRRPKDLRDGGDIDEIVLSNVDLHIEQMNEGCWWIGVYRHGNHDAYWMGNVHTDNPRSRTKLRFSEQENAGIEWDRDESHEPDNGTRKSNTSVQGSSYFDSGFAVRVVKQYWYFCDFHDIMGCHSDQAEAVCPECREEAWPRE